MMTAHNETPLDFSDSLLYRANHDFIEGDRAEPVNADEIRANLESRFGPAPSTLGQWRGKILSFILFVINMVFAGAVLIFAFVAFDKEYMTTRQAGIIFILAYIIGWGIISRLKKPLFGNLLAVSEYSPAKRDQIYKSLVDKSEVVNGTLVDVVELTGDVFLTYTVKTPKLEVVQQTYKTSAHRYSKSDVGKEVVVLYLSETMNVLL